MQLLFTYLLSLGSPPFLPYGLFFGRSLNITEQIYEEGGQIL
jgi:hypothetical protein